MEHTTPSTLEASLREAMMKDLNVSDIISNVYEMMASEYPNALHAIKLGHNPHQVSPTAFIVQAGLVVDDEAVSIRHGEKTLHLFSLDAPFIDQLMSMQCFLHHSNAEAIEAWIAQLAAREGKGLMHSISNRWLNFKHR